MKSLCQRHQLSRLVVDLSRSCQLTVEGALDALLETIFRKHQNQHLSLTEKVEARNTTHSFTMTDGPNVAEFRTMMTQVRQGETDRPDDFVFSDPSQRKKKEKAKPKWNPNNKYASDRVDDWMGAPGAKAKKGYKVKAVSTAPPPEAEEVVLVVVVLLLLRS